MVSSPINEQLFAVISQMFNDKIPFNRVLGLEVSSIRYDRVQVGFHMRDELIGNYVRGSLHGGVISSVIDVTGGLSAFMGIQHRLADADPNTILEQFGRLGTIDLRIDYLRPGLGQWFTSTGYTLRTGRRVAVTRIELNNDQQDLIAVGTGSYVIS